MSTECSICCSKLLDKDKNISSTVCGHVYHDECLQHWVRKKKVCPQCMQQVDVNKIFQIYLFAEDEAKSTDILMTRLNDVNIAMENRDKKFEETMNVVCTSLGVITEGLNDLKAENQELKAKIISMEAYNVLEGGSSSDTATLQQQLKTKNMVIGNLNKEVQDLKIQRAEATKQLLEIQQQINELKRQTNPDGNKRVPLKAVNNEQQPQRALTLSLKFDDISDRLILSD